MIISYIKVHAAIKSQRSKSAVVGVGIILCASAVSTITPTNKISSEEAKGSLPVKGKGTSPRISLPRQQRRARVAKRVGINDDASAIRKIDQDVEVTHSQENIPTKHEGSIKEGNAARPHLRLATFLREKARANTVLIIIVVMIMCYLPTTIVEYLTRELGLGPVTFRILYQWSHFLAMLNSSLNPIIYCLRVRNIRKEVVLIWRKWCTCLRCQ